MAKILVSYVFHVFNDRVKHYINNCIFYDENVDFIIICNNNTDFECPDYVKKIFRDNNGHDFGGWSEGILKNDLYKNYEKFIFLNSSVIGPFLPVYYTNKWTDIYINGLKDNVKLFGSTLYCGDVKNDAHIQSYIFSMDKTTLEYLIRCEIFSITNYKHYLYDTIIEKEIKMSRKIIENGWNIGSLMKYYENVDFTFSKKEPQEYNIKFMGDLMYNQFNNVYWNKYEIVFIKGNRITV